MVIHEMGRRRTSRTEQGAVVVIGGLNYQIAHHLFPADLRVHTPNREDHRESRAGNRRPVQQRADAAGSPPVALQHAEAARQSDPVRRRSCGWLSRTTELSHARRSGYGEARRFVLSRSHKGPRPPDPPRPLR